jgi:FKBP-type peptidyl-prolyl cis-trans isomerase
MRGSWFMVPAVLVFLVAFLQGCSGNAAELKKTDLVVGTGKEAVKGTTVQVHYAGWLYQNGKRGKKFDSSLDGGGPFSFKLGAGEVIEGWDKGVEGMKVGGKRELIIPSQLGYGQQGAPPDIPPGATLDFEIQLLNVSR